MFLTFGYDVREVVGHLSRALLGFLSSWLKQVISCIDDGTSLLNTPFTESLITDSTH